MAIIKIGNPAIDLDAAEIPNLDTAKITTGQFTDSRIADVAATKITGTITPSDSTVSLAKLTATGTKDATTFLRGDNTFAEAGGGIEMADQWRTNANVFKNSSGDITGNWEQVDSDSPGFIGSAMTQSSGIFTFPSTGIYLILAIMYIYPDGVRSYSGHQIKVTTDNSTYSDATDSVQHTTAGFNYINTNSSFILDVTDTSNVKVKLSYVSDGSATVLGTTNSTYTGMTFIRLGDT